MRGLRACLKKNVGLSRGPNSIFSDGIITVEMFMSRATPTLSGQQTGSYNALTATALTVTGDATVGGNVYASSMSGSCITSSLTSGSANVAASASALAGVYSLAASAIPAAGGTINGSLTVIGQLTASNVSVLGSYETVRAYETHSSNLVIENLGTGPALKVTQTEGGPLGPQPVAQFFNGTGEAALCIDNSGNVAINKPTAAYELDVSGTVRATTFVGDGSGLTGLAGGSAWATSGGTTSVVGSQVGIGTTSVHYANALDINGSAVMNSLQLGWYGASGMHALDVSGVAHIRGVPSMLIMYPSSGAITGPADRTMEAIQFGSEGAELATFRSLLDVSGATGGWNRALAFHTTSASTAANVERMRISSTGNVGIGRTNPTYSLDVSGSVNVSGGTITTGNSCSLCYWKLTGTTPTYSASVAVDLNIQFPLGCDATTVVAIFGTFVNGTTRMPFNMSVGGTSWTTQLYNDSTQVKMSLVAGAASASARPYSIIIITSS